ncbi:hypothetical protein ACFZB5_19835 [Streptomyces nodosus]|uniref:hypothetical protein n=1 Tax=Streptomyces nodosus TaxID=40318 RepID=UPI0036ECC05E
MSTEFIRIHPTRARLIDFARWAVAQTPKVRTVSTNTFAVPQHLFTDMPEPLLIGSIVDGHHYVSPDEDQPPGSQEATPGQPLPDVPADSYGPDATPLAPPDFAPLEDAPTEDDDSDANDQHDGLTCDVCSRPFTTARGRDTHRRQAHPEA